GQAERASGRATPRGASPHACRRIGIGLPRADPPIGTAVGTGAVAAVSAPLRFLLPAMGGFPGLPTPPSTPSAGVGLLFLVVPLPLVAAIDVTGGRSPVEFLAALLSPPLPPARKSADHLRLARPAVLYASVSVSSARHDPSSIDQVCTGA